jgi:hypothetical protein
MEMPESYSDSLPETWRELTKRPSRVRPLPIGEVEVLVVADTADLRVFSDNVWEEISSFCAGHGTAVPVTADELAMYFATALITRVRHVTSKRRDIRVEDRWALPFPMQYVVSAVGNVELESPMVTIVPTVASEAEALLLARPAWESITRRLASLEPLGLRFAKALEAKREGVARVMCLLLIGSGRELEFVADKPFTVVDALTAKAAGLRTNIELSGVFSTNPIWTPPYVMAGAEVVVFEHKFADIGYRRATA